MFFIDDYHELLGRQGDLFQADMADWSDRIERAVTGARVLVTGGAGTIGQAVVKEIFARRPAALHVVDLSENNLVELVRDVRSSLGYIGVDFRTLPLDIGSREFDAFVSDQEPYDYVLNLAALKHVRSEKDPYTLMRLVGVNVLDAKKTLDLAIRHGAKKYFAVSTDKAADPINMMGASKRIMELFLAQGARTIPVSTARFANVAFSDGSLPHGFLQRIAKRQPLAAPSDVKRYFVTPKEAGELCVLSCFAGRSGEVFFPRLDAGLELTSFVDIARRLLTRLGYEPHECASEDEARARAPELIAGGRWPCYFFESDTTGEKEAEVFHMEGETLDLGRFRNIGIVEAARGEKERDLETFTRELDRIRAAATWEKRELVELFRALLPEFAHAETGKYLDQRM